MTVELCCIVGTNVDMLKEAVSSALGPKFRPPSLSSDVLSTEVGFGSVVNIWTNSREGTCIHILVQSGQVLYFVRTMCIIGSTA